MERYRFRPTLTGVVVTAIGAAVLSSLGIWQLNRADQKRNLADAVERLMSAPATEIRGPLSREKIEQFRRVELNGHYVVEEEILIDNATMKGKAGYFVMTPLRIDDGDFHVMINRGWIPLGKDRDQAPDTEAPKGLQKLKGRIDFFRSKPAFVSDDLSPISQDGRVWFYLDPGLYVNNSGLTIEPYQVLLDPESDGGYERAWPEFEGRDGMHLAYAVQWFAFALFAVFVFFWVSIKKNG